MGASHVNNQAITSRGAFVAPVGPFLENHPNSAPLVDWQARPSIEHTPVERDILDTPLFKRLSGIRQRATLSFTSFGNRVSTTRAEHSDGARMLGWRISQNIRVLDHLGTECQFGLNPRDAQLVSLQALLHDSGHLPFSHALDHAHAVGHLNLCYDHDDKKVLRAILKASGVGQVLEKHGFSLDELMEGFEPTHPFSAIVKAYCDRGDYLVRDLVASGFPEQASIVADALDLIFDNLVIKLPCDGDIKNAAIGICSINGSDEDYRIKNAMKVVAIARAADLEWGGSHPSALVVRSMLIKALGRVATTDGDKQELLNILKEFDDADLEDQVIGFFGDADREAFISKEVERRVSFIASIKYDDFKEGCLSSLITEDQVSSILEEAVGRRVFEKLIIGFNKPSAISKPLNFKLYDPDTNRFSDFPVLSTIPTERMFLTICGFGLSPQELSDVTNRVHARLSRFVVPEAQLDFNTLVYFPPTPDFSFFDLGPS